MSQPYFTRDQKLVLDLIAKGAWPCACISLLPQNYLIAVNDLNKRGLLTYIESPAAYRISEAGLEAIGQHEDHGEHMPFAMLPQTRKGKG